jgi:PAS domain S-box-containing protein
MKDSNQNKQELVSELKRMRQRVAELEAAETEHKRTEETLRQSEERYRTILHEMDEGYYEVDLAGRYTFFNDVICARLGYSREELMGINYRVYTPEEDVKSVFKVYNEVYRTGRPRRWFPAVNIAKDGTRTFIENSILSIRDSEGRIIGFRGISRDVTERKRMEEERRQLEQKAQLASRLASVGEMASGIAHEINNPLTGVIGYAQLLLQGELPENIRKDLETINDGAQRVANVIQRLLAFARQYKPQRTYVNINDVVATTLDLRGYHLETSNIKVSAQLAPDLPVTIADAGQLQQVFLNLIVNAEAEMNLARGSGRLSIKTQQIENNIRISFKDDGPGIARENLERIFDPFFTTRQVGQGTGLGLSVCYGIVSEHGGRIYAESKPGKGATFNVELPIVTADKQLEFPEPDVQGQQKVSGAKILVVDDEPVVREFISKVLTEEGHRVETVDNAEDALEMVKSKTYRIILLDIKMPGMSGIELYKRFQKMAPSLARRVVFVTGDVLGARTTAFLSKAKSPYITKPFDGKQLNIAINRIFTEGR